MIWLLIYKLTLDLDSLVKWSALYMRMLAFMLENLLRGNLRRMRLHAATQVPAGRLQHHAYSHWNGEQSAYLSRVQNFYDAAFNRPVERVQASVRPSSIGLGETCV
jgi:hypothetical protein